MLSIIIIISASFQFPAIRKIMFRSGSGIGIEIFLHQRGQGATAISVSGPLGAEKGWGAPLPFAPLRFSIRIMSDFINTHGDFNRPRKILIRLLFAPPVSE